MFLVYHNYIIIASLELFLYKKLLSNTIKVDKKHQKEYTTKVVKLQNIKGE